MKIVYSAENSFIVNNVKNLLETKDIEVMIKNEYAQGAVGEISPFDSWPELWVVNDSDFDSAMAIVKSSQQSNDSAEWSCKSCSEKNASSFEICWNCQTEKT